MARVRRQAALKRIIRALRIQLRARNHFILQLESKLLIEQFDKTLLLDTLATVKETITVALDSLQRGGSPYT
jgi:hypothetical protein